jgi:hypothetical protein
VYFSEAEFSKFINTLSTKTPNLPCVDMHCVRKRYSVLCQLSGNISVMAILQDQLTRMMKVAASMDTTWQKLDVLTEYYECVVKQHQALTESGILRSNSAQASGRILASAGDGVGDNCAQLLCDLLFGFDRSGGLQTSFMGEDVGLTREFGDAMTNGCHWLTSCVDPFVFYTWGYTEVLRLYNKKFHYLTAQNLKIANELHASSVMCRLGMHNNFTVLGVCVVVADCMGKLMMNLHVGGSKTITVKNMYKSTSVGFDNVREVVDVWRTMYEEYLGVGNSADDDQHIAQVGSVVSFQ